MGIGKSAGFCDFTFAQAIFPVIENKDWDLQSVMKLLEVMQDKVLKSYTKVLASPPHKCPVDHWTEMIMGPQADFEYHLFKNWGFDVPLSAQRAFFTVMLGPRKSYLNSNEDLMRLQSIAGLAKE